MKYHNVIMAFCFLGLVDRVEDEYALVEYYDNDSNKVHYSEIPLVLFPCNIQEGDFFYANEVDGVMEIRCGEPPD